MMKKLLFLTILLVVVAFSAQAQWTFVKMWPDSATTKGWNTGINNGIAVDKAGNIWLQSYAGDADSLPGVTPVRKTGVIRVFTPAGTEVGFSPIRILTGTDATGVPAVDTLGGSGYGLSTDPATGNILSVKTSGRIWSIDYKTGKGIKRIISPIPGYTSSLGAVGVDNFSEIFIAPVVPGAAVGILNPDFSAAGTVTTATAGYSRACAVSGDGNDVYVALFDKKKIMIYHSDNGSLGPYAVKDSILGFVAETLVWGPNGYLWTTSGNITSGAPDPPYSSYAWYAIDVATKAVKDSIKWQGDLSLDPRPRGIAFSPDGKTAYCAVFNAQPAVEKFVKGAVFVEKETDLVPTGYALSQNYPNPFNPSTQIRFTITQTATTTLKVYDMMGREVATLVNESLAPGAYNVKFDAKSLSSGTYVYVLTSGGNRLMNKMLLLK